MLPPNWFDDNIYDYLELCSKLDESIISALVKRILRHGDISRWRVDKLQESGMIYEDILREIAKQSQKTEQEIKKLFDNAGVTTIHFDDEIYKLAGLSPIPIKQSEMLLRALKAGMKKTNGIVKNLTLTTANTSQTAYINACDLAYMQVTSGAFDYNTAIRNAVKAAISEGLNVLYPSGHSDKLDVAIRRALLTGVNQTSGVLQEMRANEMGCDLVETTAHGGARPSHAQWQGKVFSRSGKHKKYPPFISSTGYGTGAGLCGWNCRHSFYPFFEGLSINAYTKSQLNELANKKVRYNCETIPLYDATQLQRSMERGIRATRREVSAYNTAVETAANAELQNAFKADFNSSAIKLKAQEQALKDFCNQTGLYRETSRLQVYGFDKSVSQKAVWAKKRFTKK